MGNEIYEIDSDRCTNVSGTTTSRPARAFCPIDNTIIINRNTPNPRQLWDKFVVLHHAVYFIFDDHRGARVTSLSPSSHALFHAQLRRHLSARREISAPFSRTSFTTSHCSTPSRYGCPCPALSPRLFHCKRFAESEPALMLLIDSPFIGHKYVLPAGRRCVQSLFDTGYLNDIRTKPKILINGVLPASGFSFHVRHPINHNHG